MPGGDVQLSPPVIEMFRKPDMFVLFALVRKSNTMIVAPRSAIATP